MSRKLTLPGVFEKEPITTWPIYLTKMVEEGASPESLLRAAGFCRGACAVRVSISEKEKSIADVTIKAMELHAKQGVEKRNEARRASVRFRLRVA